MAGSHDSKSAGRIAFTYPAFVFYEFARFFVVASLEMQSVAVGWQIYELTHSTFDLGLVGLCQFLPGILLFLVSGHVADRFNRRNLLILCYVGFATCSALLLFSTHRGEPSVRPIYAVLVLLGVVRSFNGPVSRALLPQLVPEEHFPNAVAWHSTIFQAATILGPSIGGLVYAAFRGASAVYATAVASAVVAVICTTMVRLNVGARVREPINLSSVLAGLRYIWQRKVVLDLTRSFCNVVGRGRSAIARVRARDSSHWPVGTRIAANCSGGWCGGYGSFVGLSSAETSRRCDHALVCKRLWRVYYSFRNLAEPDCIVAGSGARGCDGHGQRGDSGYFGPTADPGPDARTRERRGHDVHWSIQPVG
jgi:MFS family permease